MIDRPDKVEIEAALENPANRYLAWKQLEDGTYVAVVELMFTTAICVDMSVTGYANRFCFTDHWQALSEFRKMTSIDTEPTGWIARR